MSMFYMNTFKPRKTTPQSRPVPGKNMVKNDAGGYVFELDKWNALDRFLIIGTEGGTFYVGQKKLTKAATKNVLECIKEDGARVVRRIVEISSAGRAADNDPALFALALVSKFGGLEARRDAFSALDRVARIGTHLFHFVAFRESFGGWGRGMKRAIQNWYQTKSLDRLAFQGVKYRQRDGWSHRDLLRLSKPVPTSDDRSNLYKYLVSGEVVGEMPKIVDGFRSVQEAASASQAADIIRRYRLPREAVPTQFLNSVEVWEALLQNMPMNAMVRNLGKMSSVGLLNNPEATASVINQLTDNDAVRGSRLHPMKVLYTLKTYSSGRGFKGNLTWNVNREIVAALNDAFYKSFKNVEPSGKRFLVAVDVSGSMTFSGLSGGLMTCAEAAAALSMSIIRSEQNSMVFGFSSHFKDLGFNANHSLEDVLRKTNDRNFGSTDCALPMIWAGSNNLNADVFVVLTDNETWYGPVHPYQALRDYRMKTGIPAKLIVIGMLGTKRTIADPSDAGMLDVAGFDASIPELVTNFASGWEEVPSTVN